MAGWVRVDAKAAQRHPLFGFGGWLRLPSALMVLGIVGAGAIAWKEWIGLGNPLLADPANGVAAIVANVTVVALAGLQLAMAMLWFRRWPHFRRFYWGYAAFASLALPIVALTLGDTAGIGGAAGGQEGDLVGDTLINLAFHLAFLAYLQRSRRFRVTFESSVRPAEVTPPPASRWPAPRPGPSD